MQIVCVVLQGWWWCRCREFVCRARPRVLVLVILRVVDLAVLALTREIIIIMLFHSSIWCGKHHATLLHANEYVFGFLPSWIASIGKLILEGPALCPAFDSHLGVFWQTRKKGILFCWLGKCVLCSVGHQKLKIALFRKERKPDYDKEGLSHCFYGGHASSVVVW